VSGANGSPGGRSRALAERLFRGRRRYVIAAAVVVIWLAVAVIVALATASGVVWF
jgi:hypothetical protein